MNSKVSGARKHRIIAFLHEILNAATRIITRQRDTKGDTQADHIACRPETVTRVF